jgi:hypothetical protein
LTAFSLTTFSLRVMEENLSSNIFYPTEMPASSWLQTKRMSI